jgi:phosphoribosylformimino-5-aminoimidazole carboxamide ribotide isomerase
VRWGTYAAGAGTKSEIKRLGGTNQTLYVSSEEKALNPTALGTILRCFRPTGPSASTMTKFRGCIDLHSGVVKQIVGGTLSDATPSALKTNFTSTLPSSHFATLYRDSGISGCHVIKLGPGCDSAAEEALKTWPNGLQIGGGITDENARGWIEKGAEKVIVTSYLFPDAKFSVDRLEKVLAEVGGKRWLVIDLSCRRRDHRWFVAMNRWQTVTDTEINKGTPKTKTLPRQPLKANGLGEIETLDLLSSYCSEFLIHAADVEGLCRGIDKDLVKALGEWGTIPITYAGGAYSIEDLKTVEELSGGKVDLTYGSALDIFGGDKVKFEDCVRWNQSKI